MSKRKRNRLWLVDKKAEFQNLIAMAAFLLISGNALAATTFEFNGTVDACLSCAVVPIGSEIRVQIRVDAVSDFDEVAAISTSELRSIRWMLPNEPFSDEYVAVTVMGEIENNIVRTLDVAGLTWLEPREPIYSEACGCFIGAIPTQIYFSFDATGWSFGKIANKDDPGVTASPPRGLGYSSDFGWIEGSGSFYAVSVVPIAPAFLLFVPSALLLMRKRRK